jgi:hypothetical protein
MNSNYFYINEKSLSKEVCIDIIDLFESETDKYEGQTISGLNKEIKDTIEFLIPHQCQIKSEILIKIRKLLEKELDINIKKYVQNTNNFVSNIEENSDHKYRNFDNFLVFDTMQIQKYVKTKGRYVYHHDFMVDKKDNKYRVITFIWYLNNVDEGGETEFWSNYMIKPTAGKLVLFPACWTFPHRGKMPISHDKYIITGWVYTKI